MKNIFGYILVFLLLLIVGCENLIEPQKEKDISTPYFPLTLGNKWYYKYWDSFDSTFVYPESIIMTEEVISTRSLNSKLFFLIEQCYLNLDGSIRRKDSIYYNFSADTLYQILNNWEFSQESLSIRAIFAETGHVSYQMKWYNDYYEAYSRFETDTTMNFVYYQPYVVDSGSERKFKKNVGVCDYISYQTVSKKLVKYEFY
jgi:hypothetical protein